MKKIAIEINKGFNAYISEGEIANLPKLINAAGKYSKIIIITDSNIKKEYLPTIKEIMEKAKMPVLSYALDAKTVANTMEIAIKVSEFLHSQAFDNGSLIIGLGGGKICSLVAFVASIYMGGVEHVLMPTTFHSMVDINLNGKIELSSRVEKLTYGCYNQPKFILCDTTFLTSNSDDELRKGFGVVIRLGMLKEIGIIDALLGYDAHDVYLDIICECIKLKHLFLSGDADVSGRSKMLTLGQPFTECFMQLNPDLAVGEADFYGVYAVIKYFGKGRVGSELLLDKITKFGDKYGFDLTQFDSLHIDNNFLKMAVGDVDKISFIYPNAVGDCTVEELNLGGLPLNMTQNVLQKYNYDVKINNLKGLKGDINYVASHSIGHRMLAIGAFSSSHTKLNNLAIDDDLMSITTFLRAIGMSVTVGDNWVELAQTDKFYNFLSYSGQHVVKVNVRDSLSTFAISLAVCAMMGVSAEFTGQPEILTDDIQELINILTSGGIKTTKFAFPLAIKGRFKLNKIKIELSSIESALALVIATFCSRTKVELELPYAPNSEHTMVILLDILRKLKSKVVVSGHTIKLDCEQSDILDKVSLNNDMDYSNMSSWIIAKELGADINLGANYFKKLSSGDKVVVDYISKMGDSEPKGGTDISNFPDLLPMLVVLNYARGRFAKLRYSIGRNDAEYKRADNIISNISNLGGKGDIATDNIQIYVGKLRGGVVDSYNDCKIAQAFTVIALALTEGTITIKNAHAVRKVYPMFYADLCKMGADIEIVSISKV